MAKNQKSRWQRWIIIALLVVVIGLLIGWRQQSGSSIAAFHVEQHNIVETVVGIGRVVPPSRIEIGSMRLGPVTRVLVEEGQLVKTGELLVHLDDTEPLSAVAQTSAAVRQERIKLQNLQGVTKSNAKNDVAQAELDVLQARDDFSRVQLLFASGAANEAQLEAVRNRLDSAKKKREKAVLEASTLGPKGGTFRLALASLAAAEAQLEQEKARLAYAHVHSPVDGLVLSRKVEPGTIVQPGQTLIVLAKTGDTRVEVPVDEKNLGKLNVGDRAMISSDAFPDQAFQATVSKLAPAVDPDSGTLDVSLAIPDPPDFLKAEMTVSVEIELDFKPNALVFPAEAIHYDAGGKPFVYVDDDGRAAKRPVVIGVRGDYLLEAQKGLKKGDTILLPGAQSITEGQKVRSEIHAIRR